MTAPPNSIVVLPRQRGYTLIELTVTIAVASIFLSGVVASSLQTFHRQYERQLDYANAQQNGRVAIDLMRHYLRRTGWGFQNSKGALGYAFVGHCSDDSVPGRDETDNCNNVDSDAGSDRLRLAYGKALGFTPNKRPPYCDSCLGIGQRIPTDWGRPPFTVTFPNPIEESLAGELGFLSGICPHRGVYWHRLVEIVSDTSNPSYHHVLQYEELPTVIPQKGGTCGNIEWGTSNGGLLTLLDFRIDREQFAVDGDPPEEHPTLLVRTDPRVSWDVDNAEVMVVAPDVDDFQVEYGMDMDDNPDGEVDRWCNHPITDCHVQGWNAWLRVQRVVAVRIALVMRSPLYRAALDTDAEKELQVFDHLLADTSDGYKRWIYRATVWLRNNSLRYIADPES